MAHYLLTNQYGQQSPGRVAIAEAELYNIASKYGYYSLVALDSIRLHKAIAGFI